MPMIRHLTSCRALVVEGESCDCGAMRERTEQEARATVALKDQIACVRRELAMRRNAYPKWVASGRMKQDEATREISRMQGVHDTLMRMMATETEMRAEAARVLLADPMSAVATAFIAGVNFVRGAQ